MTEETWNTADVPGGSDPEAERIVLEIEETRSDMGVTIDEIGHRLQPQTIADEARDKIREATVGRVERMVDDAGQTAQRTGNTLVETIRQNPVPAALAGIGAGWLMLRMRGQGSSSYGDGYGYGYRSSGARGGSDRGYGYSSGSRSGYGSSGYVGEDYRGAGYTGQTGYEGSSTGPLDGARDVADQAMGRAQEVTSNVQRAAQGTIDDVQQRARDAQWQAQSALQDAQSQADRTYNENPLALGALALGVGAAVALAIPPTQKERELMGDQANKVVEQAAGAVSQAMDQAQTKVQQTSEQLANKASNEG